MYSGREMSPFMKVRKSLRISEVCGSSGVNPSTCFTITVKVNWGIKKQKNCVRYISSDIFTNLINKNVHLLRENVKRTIVHTAKISTFVTSHNS